MGAGLVGVVAPVQGAGAEEGEQQGEGQQPDGGADRAQAGEVHGERGAGCRMTIAVPMTEAYQFGPR